MIKKICKYWEKFPPANLSNYGKCKLDLENPGGFKGSYISIYDLKLSVGQINDFFEHSKTARLVNINCDCINKLIKEESIKSN